MFVMRAQPLSTGLVSGFSRFASCALSLDLFGARDLGGGGDPGDEWVRGHESPDLDSSVGRPSRTQHHRSTRVARHFRHIL